jgi:DNA-binding MarR family transcriptional regulator
MKLEKEISQKKFQSEAHKLGVNLIFTYNWLEAITSALLKPHGITTQQFNVLRILRGQHPGHASVKLIRERMLDKMSDASRIVEKLRVKGLIDRTISSDDRRACEVIITEKGLNILSNIDKESISFESTFSKLTDGEVKYLNDLLDKLRGE